MKIQRYAAPGHKFHLSHQFSICSHAGSPRKSLPIITVVSWLCPPSIGTLSKNISILSKNESIKSYYNLSNTVFNNNLIPKSYHDIEQASMILLINTNLQISHPILFNYIKKAKNLGAKIISLNINNIHPSRITKRIIDYEFNWQYTTW